INCVILTSVLPQKLQKVYDFFETEAKSELPQFKPRYLLLFLIFETKRHVMRFR
ncbi:unnamed protein product, partial [Allacma fusca]